MGTRQIVIHVPEKVLLAAKSDEATFAHELSILVAAKLYEPGRLSSERAAELAGMSQVEFLLAGTTPTMATSCRLITPLEQMHNNYR